MTLLSTRLGRRLLALVGIVVLLGASVPGVAASGLSDTLATTTFPYLNDFEAAIGPEWSSTKTDVTPIGSRRFLGQFANQTVKLSLSELPAHSNLTISFALFMMHGMSGDFDHGPDTWDLRVTNGPTLLHTTFSNVVYYYGWTQTYPDTYPGDHHQPQTGAAERESLGFLYLNNTPTSAVYRLRYTFPHTADAVTFNFSAMNYDGNLDIESWGLDDVCVAEQAAQCPTIPSTLRLAPAGALAGGPGPTLTMDGSGFVDGAVMTWNGQPRPTTFVSSTRLSAAITATDVAVPTAVPVAVVNPNGRASNPQTFTVLTPGDSLIPNGSFETPTQPNQTNTLGVGQTFGGWTVALDKVQVDQSSYLQAAQGNQVIDLLRGGIFRDIPTIPGMRYRLRFSLSGNSRGGSLMKRIVLKWGDTIVDRPFVLTFDRSPSNMGWIDHEYEVVASATTTRLAFDSAVWMPWVSGIVPGPVLDDVALIPAHAPRVRITPGQLAFPEQALGTTSAVNTLTLTNTGDLPLTISAISLAGTNPGDFRRTSTCAGTLAIGAHCAIGVTFQPTASGARSAILHVADDAPGSPHQVALSGIGLGPIVQLAPARLAFVGRAIASTSLSSTVTLTNTGASLLTISSISLAGTNPSDFHLSSACPSTLEVGASCTIAVTFRPTAGGVRSASLRISDDAPGSPHQLALWGSGLLNLLTNPGFETDANANAIADRWSADPHFSRVSSPRHSGLYALQYRADDDAIARVFHQRIPDIVAGEPYAFSAWVTIPPVSDTFSLRFLLQWHDASSHLIQQVVPARLTTSTAGWAQVSMPLLAPPGTDNAVLLLHVSGLRGQAVVDDVFVGNLLLNPGLERAGSTSGSSESWSSEAHVQRVAEAAHSGSAGLRYSGDDTTVATSGQRVSVTAGQSYSASGWLRIPPTADTFTARLEVVWLSATNQLVSSSVVGRSYGTATTGWVQARASVVAPPTATTALMRLVVIGLNGTLDADDFALWP